MTRSRLQRAATHEPTTLSTGRGLYHRDFVRPVPREKGGSCCYRTPKLTEQSENVYENKGSPSNGAESVVSAKMTSESPTRRDHAQPVRSTVNHSTTRLPPGYNNPAANNQARNFGTESCGFFRGSSVL